MMTNELMLLAPQIILVITGMVLMLLEPFTAPAQKSRLARVAVLGTVVAAFSLMPQWNIHPRMILKGMFIVDNFSVFFQWLFLIIGAVTAYLSMKFNERESIDRGEYYALLLFACSGASLMAASADLILTFLGIEILSISTYILAGFKRDDARSNESSLKYFLLGSFATAILLYGIALIYGGTGSTSYGVIYQLALYQRSIPTVTLIGLGLLLVGFGFKVALVPFHSWVPDVYEGAPTPVTAFMAVGPKAAGFAALMRILLQAFPLLSHDWVNVLWLLAILTMTMGNVVAVLQTNIKRMLAYSAIAHAGYILVGIVAGPDAGYQAVLFYLVAYTVMNLLAFSVVLSLSRQGDMHVHLSDYAGLARKSPFAAAVLSLALISLAGIPLTGGFMGKFYLFSAAIQRGYIALAIIGVLNSVVSVFYYFRIMVYMYMKEPGEQALEPETVSWPVQAIMVLGAIGVLFLGVWPAPILELAARSSFALK
ncbi:MAG TPA: NADH-quinone oxidoreductase subunit N [Acidobacteriota bacterium]|nr:NADH-quinone oxidoreductase subunit N [Acidobacteriota bacterium]